MSLEILSMIAVVWTVLPVYLSWAESLFLSYSAIRAVASTTIGAAFAAGCVTAAFAVVGCEFVDEFAGLEFEPLLPPIAPITPKIRITATIPVMIGWRLNQFRWSARQ